MYQKVDNLNLRADLSLSAAETCYFSDKIAEYFLSTQT